MHTLKNAITITIQLCICLLATGKTLPASAQPDSAQRAFFLEQEKVLQDDYRLCSGDSTKRPTAHLLQWKKQIDSLTSSPDYPTIIRKFALETGLSPQDVRPCEVAIWLKKVAREIEESTTFLTEKRSAAIKRRHDSLFVAHELVTTTSALYDIKGIPFGISLRGFTLLAAQAGLNKLSSSARVLRYDSLQLGTLFVNAAFHFSKESHYWCYELESALFPSDSLDSQARSFCKRMTSQFIKIANREPDHIYRVGRYDIIPGRLAICKLWSFKEGTVYIGLARNSQHYYAKTIVQEK